MCECNGWFGDCDLLLLMWFVGYIGGDLVGFFLINEYWVGLFGLDVLGYGVVVVLFSVWLVVLFLGDKEYNIVLWLND